jgi:hypothetical protein
MSQAPGRPGVPKNHARANGVSPVADCPLERLVGAILPCLLNHNGKLRICRALVEVKCSLLLYLNKSLR